MRFNVFPLTFTIYPIWRKRTSQPGKLPCLIRHFVLKRCALQNYKNSQWLPLGGINRPWLLFSQTLFRETRHLPFEFVLNIILTYFQLAILKPFFTIGHSLRSKRIRFVSEQRKTENGIFGFDHPLPTLLLGPFFARSLTRVPRSFTPKPHGEASYTGYKGHYLVNSLGFLFLVSNFRSSRFLLN